MLSEYPKAVIYRILFVCGFVLLGLGLSILVEGFLQGPVPPRQITSADSAATVLQDPVELSEFSLNDHMGQAFTREQLNNKWTFLFFGYTHCPDICPMTLSLLDEIYNILQKQGWSNLLQTVFVSIDPARDNNRTLAEYIGYFNPAFIGISGGEAELKKLTMPLGIFFSKAVVGQEKGDYQVNHSTSILLIDPEARLRAIISPRHNAQEIAEDFTRISRLFAN